MGRISLSLWCVWPFLSIKQKNKPQAVHCIKCPLGHSFVHPLNREKQKGCHALLLIYFRLFILWIGSTTNGQTYLLLVNIWIFAQPDLMLCENRQGVKPPWMAPLINSIPPIYFSHNLISYFCDFLREIIIYLQLFKILRYQSIFHTRFKPSRFWGHDFIFVCD